MSKLDLLRPIKTGLPLSQCDRIQEYTQDNIKTLLNGPKCPLMVVDVSLLRPSRMNNKHWTLKRGGSTSTQETHYSHHLGEWVLIFLLSIISILIYYV